MIAADPRKAADPTPVDLAATADEAVALLRDGAAGRGLRLSRDGAAVAVETIGSRAALLRLVIALATNALDHARSEVTVTVTSAASGDAVVRVADDGPGFPPEVAATAFERFASGRAAAAAGVDADPDTGTDAAPETAVTRHYGLGLAIVAEIVRRHHGTVRIEHPPSGASIVCVFPRNRRPARG
ncbi:ATP-binding protein [Herbiconiux sp. CPCC 205716]|uniref:histidine kinase n=1 Tax=Herbiconiux gentiana TaxID=2970912 RepID=A0ABT2GHQ3_9MICO|nr:ATP-binding protein [Herbiconiux gentiana]